MLYDCFYSFSMKILQKNAPSTLSLYYPFGGVHLLPNLLAFSYVLCYPSILSNTRALISFFYLLWHCFYLHFRSYFPPHILRREEFFPPIPCLPKRCPNKEKLKCRISGFKVTMLREYMGEDAAIR